MLRERDSDDVWLALASPGRRHRFLAGRVDRPPGQAAGGRRRCGRLGPGIPGSISRRLLGRSRQSALGCRPAEHQGFRRRLRSGHFGRPNPAAAGRDRDRRCWRGLASPPRLTPIAKASSGSKRIAGRLYRHQRVRTGSETTAGNLDLFRLFAERNMDLTARGRRDRRADALRVPCQRGHHRHSPPVSSGSRRCGGACRSKTVAASSISTADSSST